MSRTSPDPLVAELHRLSFHPPVVERELRQSGPWPAITLTLAERQTIGRAQREAMDQTIRYPGWRQLDGDAQRAHLTRVIENARAHARQRIRFERMEGRTAGAGR